MVRRAEEERKGECPSAYRQHWEMAMLRLLSFPSFTRDDGLCASVTSIKRREGVRESEGRFHELLSLSLSLLHALFLSALQKVD